MKPLSVLLSVLLLAGVLPGCFENPLYDDDCCWDPAPPADYPPPPGPPDVSATAATVSATFVTGRGGTVTIRVRVSNARDVESAYDIEGQLTLADGSAEIGRASIYLGNLDANRWTETSVDIPINALPRSARITLDLRWRDMYDNAYERHINGSALLKTTPEG